MKKIVGIWMVVVAVLVFAGCRYEDGALASLRGRENRVVGTKKIVAYEVDGVDSMPYLQTIFDTTGAETTGFRWNSELDGSLIVCPSGLCINGYWELVPAKDSIFLIMPTAVFAGNHMPRGQWQILRLSYRELWLTIDKNSKNYVLKLEEIQKPR